MVMGRVVCGLSAICDFGPEGLILISCCLIPVMLRVTETEENLEQEHCQCITINLK